MPEYGPHVHYDLPPDSELVYHGPQEPKTVTEPSREIPVLREADVVVVGGGPGGCAAAVTAARNGAKTILVERYGHLGGMATGGLVNIIPNLADIYGKQGIGGFCQEYITRLKTGAPATSRPGRVGASRTPPWWRNTARPT